MLGRAQRSRSYSILAALILLVVVEEAFHVLNPVAARLTTVADWANEWTGVSTGVLAEVLLYGLVAAIGFALLAISYWYGSWNERLAVRTIMMLLLIGGLFAGPVSMLSSADQGGRWLYIEELGEGLAFSLIAGYVLGLIVSESAARSTGVPRS